VEIFDKLEERDFSLLTYINMIHRETEDFIVKKHTVEEKRKTAELETNEKHCDSKYKVSRLDQNTANIRLDCEEKEKKDAVLDAIMVQILPILRDACSDISVIGVEDEPEIPENCVDIFQMVRMIESTVNLYQERYIRKLPRLREKGALLRAQELPSSNLDSDEEDDGQWEERDRPLTHAELKQRVDKNLLVPRRRRFQPNQINDTPCNGSKDHGRGTIAETPRHNPRAMSGLSHTQSPPSTGRPTAFFSAVALLRLDSSCRRF